jgi:hypothetical protein
MIYTHALQQGVAGVRSPLDFAAPAAPAAGRGGRGADPDGSS